MPKVVENVQLPISTRLFAQEIEAVDELWTANPEVASRAEMIRLLVRQGIRAVSKQNRQLSVAAPEVTYEGYAKRAEVFMEALSDLLAKMEQQNKEGAVKLARDIADASTAYADDLAERHAQ